MVIAACDGSVCSTRGRSDWNFVQKGVPTTRDIRTKDPNLPSQVVSIVHDP